MNETLRSWLRLSGRTARIPFILKIIALVLINLLVIGPLDSLALSLFPSSMFLLGFLGFFLLSIHIISWWLSVTATVQRLHDFDFSGWWMIFGPVLQGILCAIFIFISWWLVIIAAILPYLYLFFKRGTDGANRFGEQP